MNRGREIPSRSAFYNQNDATVTLAISARMTSKDSQRDLSCCLSGPSSGTRPPRMPYTKPTRTNKLPTPTRVLMGDTSDVVSGAGMLYPAPHRLGSQEFGGDTPWLWLLKSFLKSTSPEPGWRWPLWVNVRHATKPT